LGFSFSVEGGGNRRLSRLKIVDRKGQDNGRFGNPALCSAHTAPQRDTPQRSILRFQKNLWTNRRGGAN